MQHRLLISRHEHARPADALGAMHQHRLIGWIGCDRDEFLQIFSARPAAQRHGDADKMDPLRLAVIDLLLKLWLARIRPARDRRSG